MVLYVFISCNRFVYVSGNSEYSYKRIIEVVLVCRCLFSGGRLWTRSPSSRFMRGEAVYLNKPASVTSAQGHTYGRTRADEQTDRQTGRQTDGRTDRQTDGQTGRQTDRKTGRQAGRQTDRQAAGRQTGRQTEKPSHR